MTQATENRSAPTALPVPSEKMEDLVKRVKAVYPNVIIGKQAEIDPHLDEVRDYANYAIAYWTTQLAVANLGIYQQLGDAEVGTINGIPVIKRYQGDVAPEVEPRKGGWRDYLKGVKH
jgi:hypothetical protein